MQKQGFSPCLKVAKNIYKYFVYIVTERKHLVHHNRSIYDHHLLFFPADDAKCITKNCLFSEQCCCIVQLSMDLNVTVRCPLISYDRTLCMRECVFVCVFVCVMNWEEGIGIHWLWREHYCSNSLTIFSLIFLERFCPYTHLFLLFCTCMSYRSLWTIEFVLVCVCVSPQKQVL